jgi:hypothetical protein
MRSRARRRPCNTRVWMRHMRKTLLLGVAAALAVTATAWATFSYRATSIASSSAMDIAAIHRGADTTGLPVAPVADYTP